MSYSSDCHQIVIFVWHNIPMSDAETMQSGPGVVNQKSWKPLGFLPYKAQWALGLALKFVIGFQVHGLFDLAVLHHQIEPIPNLATSDGWNAVGEHYQNHKEYWWAKGGGLAGNFITNFGGARDATEDSWSAYAMRKAIPGIAYCILMGAIYGNPATTLASFIITAVTTDVLYKVLGEGLLGLPHIKS
jgi:hypothetical protein